LSENVAKKQRPKIVLRVKVVTKHDVWYD